MNPPRQAEGQGRTVEEAVAFALARLGVARDEVEVEVLAQPQRGFLGILGGRPAQVRLRVVDVRQARIVRAQAFLQGIIAQFQGRFQLIVDADAERVFFSIAGDDVAPVIGRRGQTLDALQYLVNLVGNKGEDPWIRFVVDADGYRERRAQIVSKMAERAAREVQRRGTPVVLEPMNAQERRIAHMVVKAEAGVASRSEGQEPNRHVIISPDRT